ncbi:MAG: hypothetical protein H6744_14270 [Deltaproteobacteria bacterium]|nr:hypothetical protein [Deltaproteobacteria bacterium]MCB9787845.1 hypothetical protein [Deltaproteobacteria bacterium]
MRFNPLQLGVVAAVVALAMWLTDLLWQPIFRVQVTDSFALPIWMLLAIYAALQLWFWSATRERMDLSDDEVARWGPKLEEATPEIVQQWQAKIPVKDIAASIQAAHGIPVDVTLRYIIALGKHVSTQH